MDLVKRLLDEKGTAVYAVSPSTSVWDTANTMAGHHIGAILVMSDKRVVGIFSERDLLVRVVLAGRDPRGTPVSEVMTKDLVYVTPQASVGEAMAVMTERRCRHLPVLEDGDLVGLVSIGDCTRAVSRDQDFTIHHLTEYIHGKYPN